MADADAQKHGRSHYNSTKIHLFNFLACKDTSFYESLLGQSVHNIGRQVHFQRFSHLAAIFNCFSGALSAVFALCDCLLCFPVLTGVHLHGPVWSKIAVFAHTLSSLWTCMSIQPQKEGEQKVKVDLDMECEEGRPSRGTPLRFAPFRPLPLPPASPLRGNLYPTGPSPYPCAGVHKPPEGS